MFVEYHLIQNFAPSNLNRDDTGAPKDAVFGGYRRARVSSQCFKRSVRLLAAEQNLLGPQSRGIRTKKLVEILEDRLRAMNRPEPALRIKVALAAAGLKVDEHGETQYLLFLGKGEIDAFAKLIDTHWDELGSSTVDEKKTKKEAKAAAPEAVVQSAKGLLDGGKAVDVALFGRMLADLPRANLDAACQVAHAISTHRVEREFDYFTAVDDMAKGDDTGAGMIGQLEFTSATFYRYAVMDVAKLIENLQGDRELALSGLGAFTEAFSRAIPSGKQNTFAAHNPPSFIGVVLRRGSPLNLANAFEKPVIAYHDQTLTAQSVAALAQHEQKTATVFGDSRDAWAVLDLTGAWPSEQAHQAARLDDLSKWVKAQVSAGLGA